jgi:hypothetical protein
MTAAGVIEPVTAHDKVSVKLSLPQRSVHSGGWLFHHRLSASSMKVPSRHRKNRTNALALLRAAIFLAEAKRPQRRADRWGLMQDR